MCFREVCAMLNKCNCDKVAKSFNTNDNIHRIFRSGTLNEFKEFLKDNYAMQMLLRDLKLNWTCFISIAIDTLAGEIVEKLEYMIELGFDPSANNFIVFAFRGGREPEEPLGFKGDLFLFNYLINKGFDRNVIIENLIKYGRQKFVDFLNKM